MAQPSTTYKFELNLTDLDRNVYESVKQTIARHPSETEERMTVRLLAYALWYNEQLSFGRGLSDVDEPALWEKSLDDRVLHWIEVGQPDADRLTWCSRRYRSADRCTACWCVTGSSLLVRHQIPGRVSSQISSRGVGGSGLYHAQVLSQINIAAL